MNNTSILPGKKTKFYRLICRQGIENFYRGYSKIKADRVVCNKRGRNFKLALPDYNLLKRHLRPREIEKESKATANLPESTKRGRRAVAVLPLIS